MRNPWMKRNPISPRRNQKQIDFLMLGDVPEILYGGAAGGGKSEALLMGALQYVEVPGYAAILFRQTYQDLALPGALMDRAYEVLGNTSARWNSTDKSWTFPSGATLTFGYLSEENHRFRYQSSEFQYIGFDELTQFKERDYRYLFSRLRRKINNQVPLRMRAGTNPGGTGHLWVKKRFNPTFPSRNPPSRRFISAKLDDNPWIDSEEYKTTSLSQLDSQTRKQYEHGDWTDFGGNHYYPSLWPRYIDTGDAYRIGDGAGRWRHIRKVECVRLLSLDWAMGKPKKGDIREVRELDLDGNNQDILTGDCTSFTVADMTDDEEGLLFFLYNLNEKIPLGRNAPRLAEVCRRYRPFLVAGDDDNLTMTMCLECRRFRDIPTLRPMRIGSKNKLTRSQASIVRGERGLLYLPDKEQDWMEPFCDQLSSFTGEDGAQDDICDTVGILGRLADEFRPNEDREDESASLGSAGYGLEYDNNSDIYKYKEY